MSRRRSRAWLTVLLVMAAVIVLPAAAGAQIVCPAGAHVEGATPPAAFAQFCVRTNAEGGVKHGPYRAWYPSGESKDSDGQRDGRWTKWYPDGAKAGRVDFRAGKHDGRMLGWHPNGRTAVEIQFKDGEPVVALFFDGRAREASLGDAKVQDLFDGNTILSALLLEPGLVRPH